MELEEAIKILKEDLEHTKKANECGLATKGEFNKEMEAIEFIINHLTKQDKMIELMIDKLDQYCYESYCYDEFCQYEPEMCNNRDCKQCIKQYFEKKAEESE